MYMVQGWWGGILHVWQGGTGLPVFQSGLPMCHVWSEGTGLHAQWEQYEGGPLKQHAALAVCSPRGLWLVLCAAPLAQKLFK